MAGHPVLLMVISGVFVHAIVNRHEPNSLKGILALLFLPPITLSFGLNAGFLRTFGIYHLALTLSVIAYRLSPLHPLAKYPGPPLARVSCLWWSYTALSGKQHLLIQHLHKKHGDVIRTGPNHLFVRDAAAIPIVLGSKNPWPKSGRYLVVNKYDEPGALLVLPPVEHSKRRRLWDRAFTPGSLASYTPQLHYRVSELLLNLRLRTGNGRRVDIAEWFSFMALDFMGDFAYGGMFQFMKDGHDKTGFKKLIEDGVGFTEILGAMPWLRPIFVALPTPTHAVFEAAHTVGQKRKQQGSNIKDLFYYVLGEDGRGDPAETQMSSETLAQEVTLATIAGSDTTSTALANAVFYLLAKPRAMERLRAEVDSIAKDALDPDMSFNEAMVKQLPLLLESETPIKSTALAELPFLQAVINETLRLQPAVANGVPRLQPLDSSGFVVAGHIIPEGTTVQIPTYALQRDPRYFSPDPDTFWPERWLPEGPKLAAARGEAFVHDTSAFMPFNFGPGNCAGRPLALMEIRSVLAELVRQFYINFAKGMTEKAWNDALKDKFNLVNGSLWVTMEKRSTSEPINTPTRRKTW